MPAPKGTGGPKPPNRTTNSSPRTQKKRPGDLTGVRKQKLEKENADTEARVAAENALAAAEQEAQNLNEVIDYTDDQSDVEEAQDLTESLPEVAWVGESGPEILENNESESELYDNADIPLPEPKQNSVQSAVDVQRRKVIVRVNSKIEQMTFGREVIDPGDRDANPPRDPVLGNLRFYDFEENHRYKVPVDLALHLEEKGYLYH